MNREQIEKVKAALDFLCRRLEENGLYSPALQPVVLESQEALRGLEAGKCTYCGGNDRDMPCAYPGDKVPGCLRDKRLEAGETVATIQGCDPYDEREGARFSLEDLMRLDKLPKGTKLYADAAPAGMMMVPREPTEEMLLAAAMSCEWPHWYSDANVREICLEVWIDMIAAAEGKR